MLNIFLLLPIFIFTGLFSYLLKRKFPNKSFVKGFVAGLIIFSLLISLIALMLASTITDGPTLITVKLEFLTEVFLSLGLFFALPFLVGYFVARKVNDKLTSW